MDGPIWNILPVDLRSTFVDNKQNVCKTFGKWCNHDRVSTFDFVRGESVTKHYVPELMYVVTQV